MEKKERIGDIQNYEIVTKKQIDKPCNLKKCPAAIAKSVYTNLYAMADNDEVHTYDIYVCDMGEGFGQTVDDGLGSGPHCIRSVFRQTCNVGRGKYACLE